jgi:hypothetical protein
MTADPKCRGNNGQFPIRPVRRMIHALVQVFAGALHSGEHGYTVAAATPTHERKQSHMDKPDPYAELSAVMQDLTTQGVPEADIIDAAFRLAVTLPPACMARKRCHTACWTWLRWSGRRRTRARIGADGGERSNCCPECAGCGHHHGSGRGTMDEKSECEAVAKKMRELAMELERDGYPAAAITDGMLMVALDAATRSLGRATCRTSLASWRAGSRRRPTRLRDAPRRIERRGFHEVMLVSKQTGKVLAAARYG